jgi:hypothetical protein
LIAAGGALAGGCGGSHLVATRRPPSPVDLTVYVNNRGVSVSPGSVGAGPVLFLVTNQASRTVSVTISPRRGGGPALATTGPINPDGTGQVTVDFSPGEYTIRPGMPGETDAQRAGGRRIAPATVRIGRPRPSGDDALLQP